MFQVAFNPLDRPVVIDRYGRTIGGREFGIVDVDQSEAQDGVSTSGLRIYDEGSISDDQCPEAVEAARRAKAWNERAIAVSAVGLDKLNGELNEFEGSADPAGDLIRALHIELPAVRSTKKVQVEA